MKNQIFKIVENPYYSNFKLLKNLPDGHNFKYIEILDSKKRGRNKIYKIRFFEAYDGSNPWMTLHTSRFQNPGKEYIKHIRQKILEILLTDYTEVTSYAEIAKKSLEYINQNV
jgi:hypothetical protein